MENRRHYFTGAMGHRAIDAIDLLRFHVLNRLTFPAVGPWSKRYRPSTHWYLAFSFSGTGQLVLAKAHGLHWTAKCPAAQQQLSLIKGDPASLQKAAPAYKLIHRLAVRAKHRRTPGAISPAGQARPGQTPACQEPVPCSQAAKP